MFKMQYTYRVCSGYDMSLITKRLAADNALWRRYRGLISMGFLARKWAGCPALKPALLSFELGRGKVVWVCNEESVDLACQSGILWVTQGDQRDLVLTSGDNLTVHKDQRVLLHAMLDVRFTMRPHFDAG